MSAEPLYIQLTWEEPTTGELQQPLLAAPVAIGREPDQMPEQLADMAVSRLTLSHRQVSRFHALMTVVNDQLYVTDRSANGTFLNGRMLRQGSHPISSKDTLRIGPYKITASLVQSSELTSITELTAHEHTGMAQSTRPLPKNALALWLVGAGVMVAMAAGSWLVVSLLLERSRPQVPATPTSMVSPSTTRLRVPISTAVPRP